MTDVSIVIATYNITDSRVRNLVESIQQQTLSAETIMVDYGSTPQKNEALKETLEPYETELIYVPDVEWSPPRANNVGIKKALGEIIIKIDADLILEPKTIEDTVKHMSYCEAFVIRQPLYLPKKLDINQICLPRDYKLLKEQETHYQLPSYGGFFAAPSEWWHRVRGYDERYTWYGCNDWDLWNRALHSGLKHFIFGEPGLKGMRGISKYKKDTHVYHQWHEKPWIRLELSKEKFDEHRKRNRQIYNNSHNVVRNNKKWGTIR